jgi:peptidyl-prolyl cis-trans isomerase SurA
MKFSKTLILGMLLGGVLTSALGVLPTFAQDQKVLVTVNDKPITSFDVEQRMNLWKLVGGTAGGSGSPRQRALNELIDDIAKVEEARKLRIEATEKEIDVRLGEVAKGLKTDEKGLRGKLKAQGVSIDAMRQYLAGQIAFGRILRGKYKVSVEATPAEVDQKLNGYKAEIDGKVRKFMSDPRMQPVTVYQLQEINFPIDGELTNELLQSRAIEANLYLSRFKGCKNARAAATGIFNVRVGKSIEADGRKLPKQMKSVLDKTKPGRAIGPMRSPNGLQVLAFCGVRKIVPPKPEVAYPSRKQAEAAVLNEKYAKVVTKYSSQFRQGLLIEYRDPNYGP